MQIGNFTLIFHVKDIKTGAFGIDVVFAIWMSLVGWFFRCGHVWSRNQR